MRDVDLNSDLGESFGHYKIGADEAMLDLITSANVGLRFSRWRCIGHAPNCGSPR
ncbi:hypothetical protein CTI14_26450 [Methylobacterium radiotolerans]|nr:hypothetical protein CTI14_26450 [Methylobacterium radiotolerans]